VCRRYGLSALPLLDQSYDQTDQRQRRYAPIEVKVTFIASEQETQDKAAAEKDQAGDSESKPEVRRPTTEPPQT